VICMAPRAPGDSLRPRRLADASTRPLNFTVRGTGCAALRWAWVPSFRRRAGCGSVFAVSDIDYVQVGRTAHQLAADHGRDAHLYAEKLAKEAAAEGKTQEAEFWRAVSGALRPRAAS